MNQEMDCEEAARYIGYSWKSLRDWRRAGKGPAFTKLNNGYIRYAKEDLDEWLAANNKKRNEAA